MGFVQAASGVGTTDTSLTVTLGSATGAGNCLIACIGASENDTNPSPGGITLGGSAGSWAQAASAANTSGCNAGIWVDPSCAGAQTSVVISFTGGSGGSAGVAAWVFEWSGLLASPLDKAPAGATGASTSWASGSTGTLAQAGEVAFGVVAAYGSATITGPGGWTNESQLTESSTLLIAGYQALSSTTSLSYAGTQTSAVEYSACVVTLKTGSSSSGAPYALLTPPGRTSPMAWQRIARPVMPPFTVSSGDTGGGGDATTTVGRLGNLGQPLVPPGPFSPMAFQRRPAWQPRALPLAVGGDSGSAAETGAAEVIAADSGTGAETALVSQLADTGTGTDAGQVTATLSSADTGIGADSAAVRAVGTDTGTSAEASSITVRPLLKVRWRAADKLSRSGGTIGT